MPTYGAHVFLWMERFDESDLCRCLDRCVGLGLGFLEIPIGDDVSFDEAAVGAHAADLGMQLVLSPGGEWPMSADISSANGNERHAGLAWHRRAMDRCVRCGAVAYTGALYGHPGRVCRTPQSAADFGRVAAGLHQLGAWGAERGLVLAIEPMSHFRTHVVNTPAQALGLIAAADHPALRVLLDTYHLCTEITAYDRAIEQTHELLWGIHACENNRGVPGRGFIPWQSMARACRRVRWDGYVGFESYNSSVRDGRFAVSRGMFHDVCPDGDRLVREALDFLGPMLTF